MFKKLLVFILIGFVFGSPPIKGEGTSFTIDELKQFESVQNILLNHGGTIEDRLDTIMVFNKGREISDTLLLHIDIRKDIFIKCTNGSYGSFRKKVCGKTFVYNWPKTKDGIPVEPKKFLWVLNKYKKNEQNCEHFDENNLTILGESLRPAPKLYYGKSGSGIIFTSDQINKMKGLTKEERKARMLESRRKKNN